MPEMDKKFENILAKPDPYKTAQEFGIAQGHQELKDGGEKSPYLNAEQEFLLDKATYWSAWRAARNAAAAMLNKAAELNLTPEQMHALTEVAEEWAYD